MPKFVVLRRFRYPTGATGRDYHPGDDIELTSERDVKALLLLRRVQTPESVARAASPAPATTVPVTVQPAVPVRPQTAEVVAAPELSVEAPHAEQSASPMSKVMTTENNEALVPRRRYGKRKAEDETE